MTEWVDSGKLQQIVSLERNKIESAYRHDPFLSFVGSYEDEQEVLDRIITRWNSKISEAIKKARSEEQALIH